MLMLGLKKNHMKRILYNYNMQIGQQICHKNERKINENMKQNVISTHEIVWIIIKMDKQTKENASLELSFLYIFTPNSNIPNKKHNNKDFKNFLQNITSHGHQKHQILFPVFLILYNYQSHY